jgi:hypothetical protein
MSAVRAWGQPIPPSPMPLKTIEPKPRLAGTELGHQGAAKDGEAGQPLRTVLSLCLEVFQQL